MCCLVLVLKHFTELFLFLIYIRKDQAQEQSDWKHWCRCDKQKNECLTGNYNQLHNIWDFLMFYQTFLSSQVKRCAIITYKHDIYELPLELLNYLRLRTLENQEI